MYRKPQCWKQYKIQRRYCAEHKDNKPGHCLILMTIFKSMAFLWRYIRRFTPGFYLLFNRAAIVQSKIKNQIFSKGKISNFYGKKKSVKSVQLTVGFPQLIHNAFDVSQSALSYRTERKKKTPKRNSEVIGLRCNRIDCAWLEY